MSNRNKRTNLIFEAGFNSNPFPDDKYNNIEQDYSNKYCLSQRDEDDFNSDLNIFTSKYKIYENVDFNSSFFKKNSLTNINIIQERINEDQLLINEFKSPQQNYDYPDDNYENKNNNFSQNSYKQDQNSLNFQNNNDKFKNQIFGPFTSSKLYEKEDYLQNSTERTKRNVFSQEQFSSQLINQNTNEINSQQKFKKREMSVEMEFHQPNYKNLEEYYNKENMDQSQNSQDQNLSNFKNNSDYIKNQIFGPFTNTKKQDDEGYLQNSIERTRRNVFQQQQYQNQVFKLHKNDMQFQQKIQKRDMSIEIENRKIPEKIYKTQELENRKNSSQKSNKDDQKQKLNKSKKINSFNLNKQDSFYNDVDSLQNNDHFNQDNEYSCQIQYDSFYNKQDSNQKDDHKRIFETPINLQNKRRGRKAKIIDSSSTNYKNNNENSNSSFQRYSNVQKQVDLSNIISNDSSNKRLTRKSGNSLHESFKMQLFNKNSDNKKNIKRNRGSSSIMKPEAEVIQQKNKRLTNESKKLKKLVKNKRKSDSNQKRNSSQQQSQKQQNCAICLSYPEGNIGQIKCGHEFCIDCIVQWSTVTNQCPMCRQEFIQIVKKDYNDLTLQEFIQVEQKRQRIQDDDEFYWEEGSNDDDGTDEVCYICDTDQDGGKLIVCDHCEVRICHTYCDDELIDDSVPLGDWFCHECRFRSDIFD